MKVRYNTNELSTRENKLLKVFDEVNSKALSSSTLKVITGYGHKVLQKTLKKLRDKGYIERANTSGNRFYRIDQKKLRKALKDLKKKDKISDYELL